MSTAAPDVLSLENVTQRFGGVTALREVSLTVPKGGIVGVIGPNGAGKTTLFNVVTGAYTLTEGRITLGAEPLAGLKPYQIARRGVARTFQNIRLFRSMTVWEHLLVAQPVGSNPLAALVPGRLGGSDRLARAERALTTFGLEAVRDRLAVTLPYGVQRKVEMARALMSEPMLLLLDEPVAGMNHDEADELRSLLRRLRTDEALTILVIEHDMPFVMGLCEHLYVLDFGSLIAQGSPEEVRRDPVVLEAYLGKDG